MKTPTWLVEIIVCPDTHQRVALASEELLAKLNEKIALGKLRTKSGGTVSEPLTAGLIREDQKVIYAIRDDIPVMLIDEGIEVPQ